MQSVDLQHVRHALAALRVSSTAQSPVKDAGVDPTASKDHESTRLLVQVVTSSSSSSSADADRVALARLCLDAGADPNVQTSDGTPILRHALISGDHGIATELVASGARFESLVRDTTSDSLVQELISTGSIEVLQCMDRLEPEVDWDPDDAPPAYIPRLYVAVCTKQVEVAQFLLQRRHPVNVDRMWAAKLTPLARAVDLEDVDMVQLLLANGANVELHGLGMPPPLIYAARRGNVAIARLLFDAGALQDPQSPIALMAITTSIQSGFIEMTRLLLEHGVPCIAGVPLRYSLLLGAVMKSDRAMTRLLLEEGHVDVAAEDNKYELLSYALANEDELVLEIMAAMQTKGYTP
ncbi:hypothetical protein PINS_up008520 [Pythium insidiosum]|nr:hypothetical protein PINS_up008520 [Pythium insidiosum]